MGTSKPLEIPWPLSSFPGAMPQESAGRLINAASEPLGDPQDGAKGAPKPRVWRRQPGLSQYASTSQSNYRGGLIVGSLSYEVWSNQAATVDNTGTVSLLGNFPGTKKVSIARNNASPANVLGVDLDNGCYLLSGGGAPSSFNGGGNLPQPNSISFQDGYFFWTIADRRVFASALNSTTVNSLTVITIQSKSSDTLLRAIAYSGLMLFMGSSATEVWQDAATAAPAFPYNKMLVIEKGLVQANAVAGFEDGFSELLWVAQDYAVYWMTPGSFSPVKVSPPDLDRLIKTAVVGSVTLEASCYAFAGKKFWVLSTSTWTWEFNLSTLKWNERESLNTSTGLQSRWRGTLGHPAFGKWLIGDQQSGNLLFLDDMNYNDVTCLVNSVSTSYPQLFRMESGLVGDFPNRQRVARADFQFDTGVGIVTSTLNNVQNPSVAISWSDNNGLAWKNPIVRALGAQGLSKTTRISVKNTGQTGPDGRRWRIDATDAVYVGFLGATMSDDPREL